MSDLESTVAMPWGGDRNVALRAALDLAEGEMGWVSGRDAAVVAVVVASRERARELERAAERDLPDGWVTRAVELLDGRWSVTAWLP